MKNVLLALAIFLTVFTLSFQTAYAEEDGWPPRDERVNPPSSMPERGTTDDANDVYDIEQGHNKTAAKIKDKTTHPEVCDSCLLNLLDTEITKKTSASSSPGKSPSGAKPRNENGAE